MKLTYRPLPLELRDTFRITREASDHRDNVLVRLVDRTGAEGLGEAAPSRFYSQTAASVTQQLADVSLSDVVDPLFLDDILAPLRVQLQDHSSAMAGIDIALHDLMGKKLGLPLYRLLGLNPNKVPATSFTIGIASLDEIRRKTEAAAGYPILKVKLGADNDREIISTIREVSSAALRIDANAAWTVEETLANARWLQDEGVELLEQPLPKNDLDGYRRLMDSTPLPIIADESACTPEDVVRLRGCVHGVNIKLSKCGGLRPALQMIHIARAQDMQVMIGCFIESSLGIAAAAHLLPLCDYADLDGHLLISHDPFRGLEVENAKLILPDRPGIGVWASE